MRTKKRILSMLLTVCLIVGMLPQTAFATEGATIGTSGLCEHHAAHDETCGYVEGTAETPCAHEHTEDCYEITESCTHAHTEDCYPVMDSGVSGNEATPSDAAEPTECGHVCDTESGCIKEELNCAHAHDEDCGYAAAVEGHDCHYECAECAKQEQAATPTDAAEAACTCEAAEGDPHTEDCALYEAPADPVCTCEDKCAEDAINAECAVCGVTGAASCMAEGETSTYEGTSVTIDAASLTSSTSGTGWSFDGDKGVNNRLTLNEGYEFTISGECAVVVENHGTIVGGTFNNIVVNHGTISGGTFTDMVNNFSGGVINDGTFTGDVNNYSGGVITGGDMSSYMVHNEGTIEGGAFGYADNRGTITGGTFDVVTNDGAITITNGSVVVKKVTTGNGTITVDGAVHTHSSLTTVYKASEKEGYHLRYMDACEGCPVNYAAKFYNEELHTEGTAATCTTPATCDCGHEMAPATGHNWGDWTSISDTQHSRTCKNDSGHTETVNHTPGDAATCTTPQTCTDCGHEIASVTAHGYGTVWSKNATGHWYECSICGDKKDNAAHTPGAAATETAAQTCTVCGYEIAPALGHTHNYSTTLTYDSTGHWYPCTCSEKKDFAAHSFDNACDTDCNDGCGYTRSATHSYGTVWSKDASGHWHECSVCSDKKDFAAHTPSAAATETTAQTCTECGYEIVPTLGHTHVWGDWTSNGNGTHTRTCSTNSSHTENGNCSGGTATCKSPATCTDCGQTYGNTNSSNHTGGTEVRGKVDATATTAGYTGDTYCLGCKTKIKTGTTIPATGSGGGGTGGNTGGGDSGNDDSGDDTPPADDDKADTPSDTPADTPATPVTVPVSGEDNSIQVDAAVSGTTATIDHVDLSALNTVIGDHVENVGVVTIDFSVLNVEVDTVEIPADVVKQIAEAVNDPNNDAQSLEIVLTDGTSIEFDAKALGEKSTQAGGLDITISIKHTADSSLNNRQQQTVGNRPAYDINVTSGGKHISDMGGKVTIHAPYELRPGEKADGIVVFYVDAGGNRERCETSYDPVKKRVNWKTDHLSVYMIGYEEPQENPDTGNDIPAEEIPTSPDTGDDTPAYVTYTVQRGDTLWAIAKKYGCTVSEIVAANSDLIKNPDLIHVGWQLKIPQGGATGADTNTPDAILPDDKKTGVYIVRRGDTLWAISKKYGCTVAEIIALNGELITDPDLIFAGWELKIPQN